MMWLERQPWLGVLLLWTCNSKTSIFSLTIRERQAKHCNCYETIAQPYDIRITFNKDTVLHN